MIKKIKNYTDFTAALEHVKNTEIEPSSFLKTRILANIKAGSVKKSRNYLFVFSPKLIFSSLLLLFIFSMIFFQKVENSIFPVSKPYMVKIDIRSLKDADVDSVKVELAGVISFSSKKFTEIKNLKELTLSWENLVGKQYIPIVIEGEKSGKGSLKVYFYNSQNKLITNKLLSFKFKES